MAVRGRSVVLRGLPAEQTALPVRRTQQSCGQRGLETFCSLSVLPETGLVQLPVLFYPELLDVRVDGEAAPFLPLVDRTYALVGLRLPPGRHEISLKLDGYRTHKFRVYVPVDQKSCTGMPGPGAPCMQ